MASSAAPCGGTEPQEWTFGSISRGELAGGLQHGVEVEADLGQPREVGPEPGQDDDLVDAVEDLAVLGRQPERIVVRRGDLRGAEAAADVDRAGLDRRSGPQSEGAPGGQLVGRATAEGGLDGGVGPATQQPRDPGRGILLDEVGERDEGGERGVAAADDGDVAAGVRRTGGAVVQVGHPIAQVGQDARVLLAEGGQTVGPERIGPGPGAAGVHDAAGKQPFLTTVARSDVDDERLVVAAVADQQVTAPASDTGDAAAVADTIAERVGEWLEVQLRPLATGRVGPRVGRGPARAGEQVGCGTVDELGPGREEPDMVPLAHRGSGPVAGLQDQRLQAPGEQVRGRGQADRPGAHNDHRQHSGGLLLSHDLPFSSFSDLSGGSARQPQQPAPAATASPLAAGSQHAAALTASATVPQQTPACVATLARGSGAVVASAACSVTGREVKVIDAGWQQAEDWLVMISPQGGEPRTERVDQVLSPAVASTFVYKRVQLALLIDACQYRRMSKQLSVVQAASQCCPPLVTAPLSEESAGELAVMFKALGDPVRLRLLSLIASAGSEACVCDLNEAFDLSQPTISHHLKVLREAGLVTSERRGTWVYYRLHPEALTPLAALLDTAAV